MPRLPGLDHSNMRRWATGATWTPADTHVLVRHRSLDGSRRIVTTDRRSPQGFEIEYDLGIVHKFAQPGTIRLLAGRDDYVCTRFEGTANASFNELGYIEEAPFPLLDPLELRMVPESGQQVLVAGPDDPLYDSAIPLKTLGFIESYPINPRHPPISKINWRISTLVRRQDPANSRHTYHTTAKTMLDEVALGGLFASPAKDLIPLRSSADGLLTSQALSCGYKPSRQPKRRAQLRWAVAPLHWSQNKIPAWAIRASASRARMLILDGNTRRNARPNEQTVEILGYMRTAPALGWSPLFSAIHPALGDQYVTRSELEAIDMGYEIDGVLGYVLDRFANRFVEEMPHEIKWASRFGHHRRYIEGFHT